jgi:hypothetical protein
MNKNQQDQIGEVKDGLHDRLERMLLDESKQLEVHLQIDVFSVATCIFGKNLANIAIDVDQLAKKFQSFSSLVV